MKGASARHEAALEAAAGAVAAAALALVLVGYVSRAHHLDARSVVAGQPQGQLPERARGAAHARSGRRASAGWPPRARSRTRRRRLETTPKTMPETTVEAGAQAKARREFEHELRFQEGNVTEARRARADSDAARRTGRRWPRRAVRRSSAGAARDAGRPLRRRLLAGAGGGRALDRRHPERQPGRAMVRKQAIAPVTTPIA